MKIDAIQHIDPIKLTTDPVIQQVIGLLLNIIEQQAARIEELERKVEELESEIKRLKTGQGNPPKGQAKALHPRPKEPGQAKGNHKSGPKKNSLHIDREESLTLDKDQLPPDAVFKGYREVVVQNLRLTRDNVLYKVAQYHSRAEGRYYSASLPADHCGAFGAELRSLLLVLRNVCNVTEGSLLKLMESAGLQISAGSINNILLSQGEDMERERTAILRAGLEHSPYAGLDGTKSFERGKRLSTQVICGEHFTVYSTQPGKSRLDILSALQGVGREEQLFAYNERTAGLLEHFDVPQKHLGLLKGLFQDRPPLTLSELIEHLDRAAPGLADRKIFERIADSFALGHYHTQADFPVVRLLMSDQGKEYNCVAGAAQSFCWLHDERPYRQFSPKLDINRQAVDNFLGQYWDFYRQLLDFKGRPPDQQQTEKVRLSVEFDRIFTQETIYENLNQQIQKTFLKKEQLLLVLEHPFLPLHNNASELAVRQQVRQRDISLHTWSPRGTKAKDAFMTVVQTAIKLGVSAFDYIADRASRRFSMTSLAELVAQAYPPVSLVF